MFLWLNKIFRTKIPTNKDTIRRRRYNTNRLKSVNNFFNNSNCILVIDSEGTPIDHFACTKGDFYNQNVKGFTIKFESLIHGMGKIKKVKCHNSNS